MIKDRSSLPLNPCSRRCTRLAGGTATNVQQEKSDGSRDYLIKQSTNYSTGVAKPLLHFYFKICYVYLQYHYRSRCCWEQNLMVLHTDVWLNVEDLHLKLTNRNLSVERFCLNSIFSIALTLGANLVLRNAHLYLKNPGKDGSYFYQKGRWKLKLGRG